ncbi:MAG: DUF998 domain-containing protein, partial [Actinomycetota bacterium]|nr:DUF998 domain-containing protein [Actinomycetota bacterium]
MTHPPAPRASPTPSARSEAISPMPWWGVASAVVAPVALIGGFLYAGSRVPGYDPVRSTISDLAAGDMPGRWLMTTALV